MKHTPTLMFLKRAIAIAMFAALLLAGRRLRVDADTAPERRWGGQLHASHKERQSLGAVYDASRER